MELLVLEHDATTGACRFADVLDSRTALVPWRRIDVTTGALPTDLDDVAGLVVMGGPQSVTPEHADEHAWLPAERELLRVAVDADVPVLAICLGAQILADAAGGEVTRREIPEVGYLPLTRTAATGEEEVTAGWPEGAAVLLVHEDAVSTLPPDAVPLLEGPSGPVAWRLGSAVATQAHPEVDHAQLTRWTGAEGLARLWDRAGIDRADLLVEAERRERVVVPLGQALIGRFVDGPVRRRVTGSKR